MALERKHAGRRLSIDQRCRAMSSIAVLSDSGQEARFVSLLLIFDLSPCLEKFGDSAVAIAHLDLAQRRYRYSSPGRGIGATCLEFALL